MIGGHTLERGVCLAIHCTIFPFLVIYIYIYIYICVCVCIYMCVCVCIYMYMCVYIYIYIYIYIYRVTPQKTEPISFFITSTKIKQNNSNFVHSNFCKCWWILWSQCFMDRICFISWKKEKARIKSMNFSQNKWILFLFWSPPSFSLSLSIYIYIYENKLFHDD